MTSASVRTWTSARASALGAAGLVLVLAGCTGGAPEPDPEPTTSTPPTEPAVSEIFGPGSQWRLDVTDAPTHPDSAALVAGVADQVASRTGVAAFNVAQYNSSIAVADPGTPRRDVVFDDCQGKGYTAEQLYDPAAGAHFADVPVPETAVPAAGTDQQLTVWSPSSDQLWEFWVSRREGDTWHACWGGRIDDVSASPGYFPDGMGASATGMATAGGMVLIDEARAGRIDHALTLQLPEVAAWDVFSYPAQRSDGTPDAGPGLVPEGLRLRLDPAVDVGALGLHPVAAAVARAAQRYGFIVTDRADVVAVVAESGAIEVARTGVDPWVELLGGTPDYEVMRGFPWGSLQALPVDHGAPQDR